MEWAEIKKINEKELGEENYHKIMNERRKELMEKSLSISKISEDKLENFKKNNANKFGNAAGIKKDYVEGSSFDREVQERRKQERLSNRKRNKSSSPSSSSSDSSDSSSPSREKRKKK